MTPFDDNDLIGRLQSAIVERQSGISAPEGIGDVARRAARKRTATRAVGAGVPVLAAAGVATMLAIGSNSGSTGVGRPSAGPVKVENTAYIIKRIKAKVAEDIEGGMVIHNSVYASGDDSGGALVNLGPETTDGYEYAAPDGRVFIRNVAHALENGSTASTSLDAITIDDLSPEGNGKYYDSRTVTDPGSHTYSQDEFSGLSDPETTSFPNLRSSPSEVQQALQNGQVTDTGTATVNGAPAIALSVNVRSEHSTIESASGTHTLTTDLTLYVDANTYQPLRTVLSFGGQPVLVVSDWVPATPQNIAQATDDSIPAGYTKVDDSH